MTRERAMQIKVIAAFAAVYLAWGSTFVAIRFAIESLPPFLMAGLRFLIAGSILYVFARLKKAALPSGKQWASAFLIGFLLLVCGNGAVVIAEKTVPSGMVSLLIAMVPLYFALIEWLRPGGKAPSARSSAGLLTGVLGLILLISPQNISGSGTIDLQGVLIVLLGSLAWSVGSIYSRSVHLSESLPMGIAMQTLAGGIILTLVSLLANEAQHLDISQVSGRSCLALAYLVISGSLVGFSAYVFLLKNVRASKVATYAYVNPVVAVLLGWLLGGETLTAHSLTAAAVILFAVWIITGATEEKAAKSSKPEKTNSKTEIESTEVVAAAACPD